MSDNREQLLRLVGQQVEGQLTDLDRQRLAELLRTDPQLVDLYTDYLCVHGQLLWDAGRSIGLQEPIAHSARSEAPETPGQATLFPAGRRGRRIATVAASLLALVGAWTFVSVLVSAPDDVVVRPNPSAVPAGDAPVEQTLIAENTNTNTDNDAPDRKPLELIDRNNRTEVVAQSEDAVRTTESQPHGVLQHGVLQHRILPAEFTDSMVIAKVDEFLEKSWKDHDIQPSAMAEDSEWVRRIYLTVAGRIPTVAESAVFLADDSPRKRQVMIDLLLSTPERAGYLATTWTNLLIGRTERRRVNRDKLFEFLSDAFRTNTPWIDTVGELITASGRNDQNGATNFLLAHLNDQATPATAVTAKLFLGEQISCVQCHDHPFAKGVKQEDYWALNAFFKDTVRVTVADVDSGGSRKGRSKYITCRLEDRRQVERITHFETRSGQQRAVLPKYDQHVIPEDSTDNRRLQLARLLAGDSDTKIAKAMVNRMWAHFFGFGFTSPIDDMGTHATVSHPKVLDLLTEAFVASDYDIQRLTRWIVSTRAAQLSSQSGNTVDVPENGETPLFSHVYARRMAPEQVYESIRVAIRSASGQLLTHDSASLEHRRNWVQQFARAYETDENDESLHFDGTIAQAMVMMNGTEVDDAIRQATATLVRSLPSRASESDILERIALATLTRMPGSSEKDAFRVHYRQLLQRWAPRGAMSQAVEDMMWAYLNSSEFVLVH